MGTASMTALVLGLVIAERRRAELVLAEHRDQLENLVETRTAKFDLTVHVAASFTPANLTIGTTASIAYTALNTSLQVPGGFTPFVGAGEIWEGSSTPTMVAVREPSKLSSRICFPSTAGSECIDPVQNL